MMPNLHPDIKRFFEAQGILLRRRPISIPNYHYWDAKLDTEYGPLFWAVAQYHVKTDRMQYRLGFDYVGPWYSEELALRLIKLKAFL